MYLLLLLVEKERQLKNTFLPNFKGGGGSGHEKSQIIWAVPKYHIQTPRDMHNHITLLTIYKLIVKDKISFFTDRNFHKTFDIKNGLYTFSLNNCSIYNAHFCYQKKQALKIMTPTLPKRNKGKGC